MTTEDYPLMRVLFSQKRRVQRTKPAMTRYVSTKQLSTEHLFIPFKKRYFISHVIQVVHHQHATAVDNTADNPTRDVYDHVA